MRHDPRQGGLDFTAPKARRAQALQAFHARAHVTADEVQAGERRAARQEATLLAWWAMQDAAVPGVRFTPSQVWEKLFERRVPLTSVRRAITNCTARGDLQHWPGDRVEGPFGAKEGRWSLSLSSPSEHANQRETLG